MTLTDKIIFFTGLFLFWRGWSKGFAQTILGPLALIAGSILSYLYYLLSHNLLAAVAIGIVGPIILNVIFSMMAGMLFSSDGKKHVSLVSRLGGALLNTLWGEFFLLTGIIFLLMIPVKLPTLNNAQANIQSSYTCARLQPILNQLFNKGDIPHYDPSKFIALSDPEALKAIEKSKEYQDIINDERIQALLNDPAVTGQVKDKNIGQLVQNPKFIALARDPELLKRFLALYSIMLENAKTKTTGSNAGSTPPRPL